MVDFIRMGLLELCGSRVERELQNVKFIPTVGFEPETSHLLSERATTELRRLMSTKWIKVHLVFTFLQYPMPKQTEAKRDGVIITIKIKISINLNTANFAFKRYESTVVDRRTWIHVPSGTHLSTRSDTHQVVEILK